MDTSASGGTAAATGGTTSSMVVGEEYNAMVQNIVDMGYDKSQVMKADKLKFVLSPMLSDVYIPSIR